MVITGYLGSPVSIYGRLVAFKYVGNRTKWEQVFEVIHARILDGTYGPGDRVPSEHEMVAEFDPLARGTARKVIVKLQEAGLIRSVRGLGNFVVEDDAKS